MGESKDIFKWSGVHKTRNEEEEMNNRKMFVIIAVFIVIAIAAMCIPNAEYNTMTTAEYRQMLSEGKR